MGKKSIVLKAGVESPWGVLTLSASDRGIVSLNFSRSKATDNAPKLSPRQKKLAKRNLKLAQSKIRQFMRGKKVEFNTIPVDFSDCSKFEARVLKCLRKVRFGKQVSYKALSTLAGVPEGARAVGNVMAKNPLPIILPCHRVLRENGQLGGYSGGLARKKRLLALEGMSV